MLPVILGLVWLVAANLIGMLPSRDHHWTAAYGLIAVGVPLLGWIVLTAGPWVGLLFLAGGASILRWPVHFLLQFVPKRLARKE
jgi:hypothetical protein